MLPLFEKSCIISVACSSAFHRVCCYQIFSAKFFSAKFNVTILQNVVIIEIKTKNYELVWWKKVIILTNRDINYWWCWQTSEARHITILRPHTLEEIFVIEILYKWLVPPLFGFWLSLVWSEFVSCNITETNPRRPQFLFKKCDYSYNLLDPKIHNL